MLVSSPCFTLAAFRHGGSTTSSTRRAPAHGSVRTSERIRLAFEKPRGLHDSHLTRIALLLRDRLVVELPVVHVATFAEWHLDNPRVALALRWDWFERE